MFIGKLDVIASQMQISSTAACDLQLQASGVSASVMG
jgi:hypothetical protein